FSAPSSLPLVVRLVLRAFRSACYGGRGLAEHPDFHIHTEAPSMGAEDTLQARKIALPPAASPKVHYSAGVRGGDLRALLRDGHDTAQNSRRNRDDPESRVASPVKRLASRNADGGWRPGARGEHFGRLASRNADRGWGPGARGEHSKGDLG